MLLGSENRLTVKRAEGMPFYGCQGTESCPSHLVRWQETEFGPEVSNKPATTRFHDSGHLNNRNSSFNDGNPGLGWIGWNWFIPDRSANQRIN